MQTGILKKFVLAVATLGLAVGLTAPPAGAASYYNGTKSTYSGTTWQGWVWGGIENPTAGWNMYVRIDNGDTPAMYVRWTSCSGTSSGANKLSAPRRFKAPSAPASSRTPVRCRTPGS